MQMDLTSRFYREKYPEVEDVVMVKVISISEESAFVHLLEYNNLNGKLKLPVPKETRPNKEEQVLVLHVDKENGYCELSKDHVSAKDAEKCFERFGKANKLNTLLKRVAHVLKYNTDEQLEELYSKTAWHFEKKYNSKTVAYDIFKQSITDPSVLDECDLDEKTKDVLLANIRHHFLLPTVKLFAYIKCSHYGYEGIDAVKAALKTGMNLSTEELPIAITLVSPPLYVMKMSTTKIDEGLEALRTAIESIRNKIIELNGEFEVTEPPKIATPSDEEDLAHRLERAEAENQEVGGDDDEDPLGIKFDFEKELRLVGAGVYDEDEE